MANRPTHTHSASSAKFNHMISKGSILNAPSASRSVCYLYPMRIKISQIGRVCLYWPEPKSNIAHSSVIICAEKITIGLLILHHFVRDLMKCNRKTTHPFKRYPAHQSIQNDLCLDAHITAPSGRNVIGCEDTFTEVTK